MDKEVCNILFTLGPFGQRWVTMARWKTKTTDKSGPIQKYPKNKGHSGDKAIASEKKGQCGPGQSEETFLLCEVGRIWAVSEGQVKLE